MNSGDIEFPLSYAGYAIHNQDTMDHLIDLHAIGKARGDSDQVIAATCVAWLESESMRNGASLQ
jgi:hypothetical protein